MATPTLDSADALSRLRLRLLEFPHENNRPPLAALTNGAREVVFNVTKKSYALYLFLHLSQAINGYLVLVILIGHNNDPFQNKARSGQGLVILKVVGGDSYGRR